MNTRFESIQQSRAEETRVKRMSTASYRRLIKRSVELWKNGHLLQKRAPSLVREALHYFADPVGFDETHRWNRKEDDSTPNNSIYY